MSFQKNKLKDMEYDLYPCKNTILVRPKFEIQIAIQ